MIAAAVFLATTLQANPATLPADRLAEDWWKQRHEACVARTQQGHCDVAFLGDSITQWWEEAGKPVWDAYFPPLRPTNFGFGGDQTQHVLWRLQHGELIGLHPKLVVLLIGTNNVGTCSPDQIKEGVGAIVQTLKDKLPETRILLLALFPRAANTDSPSRLKITAVNALLPSLADGQRVRFADYGRYFVNLDGSLRTSLLPDYLHPNEAGYEIWARAMATDIDRMLSGR